MRRALPFLLALAVGCDSGGDAAKPGPLEGAYTLRRLINESHDIAELRVDAVDSGGNLVRFRTERTFQGSPIAGPVSVRIEDVSIPGPWKKVDLRRHFVPGSPAVVFRNGNLALLYVNRFFLMAYGGPLPEKPGESWGVVSLERTWNQTYVRSAGELAAVLPGILSGDAPSPGMDPRRPPITREALDALPPPGAPFDADYARGPFAATPPPRPEASSPERPERPRAGLRRERFDVGVEDLAHLDRRTADAVDTVELPECPEGTAGSRITLRFQGYLEVPRDGDYALWLRSVPGARLQLRVGGRETATLHAMAETPEAGGDVVLLAGRHAVQLLYQGPRDPQAVQLLWSGPGLRKGPVPAEAYSHAP
jgi:hypothetical protein